MRNNHKKLLCIVAHPDDEVLGLGETLIKPNFYVSIKQEWDKKRKALEAYKEELGVFPHPRPIKSIEALAIKRGAESGLEKAEAFCVIRKIWL